MDDINTIIGLCNDEMKKLVRITTVPISLDLLITGQMKFMSAHKWEVIMMSAKGREIEKVKEKEGCQHIIIPMTRRITPFQDITALWIMCKELKRIQPDIVHTHTPKAGIIGMLSSWITRVPHRVHTVAGLPLELSTGLKRLLLVSIEKLTYKLATEVWPNSNSLKQYIIDHGFTSSIKLKIIGKGSSNGIDLDEFDPNTLDLNIISDIKKEINYDPQCKYLLFVGRVVKDKGVEELVEAFTKLYKNDISLRLIIVGPREIDLDPISKNILTLIDENKAIVSTGYSKFVKYYMHISDLFVFPSHREGFPNVLMQAALMNCPVLCSRINGNIDIIKHRESGLLFNKGDINDLLDKLTFALCNISEMKLLAKNNRKEIERNYSRDKMHKLILNKYNSLLNSNIV